jgi:hypothetical protein
MPLSIKARAWLSELIAYWHMFEFRSPVRLKDNEPFNVIGIIPFCSDPSPQSTWSWHGDQKPFQQADMHQIVIMLETISHNLQKQELEMSQITDAVAANTSVVNSFSEAASQLSESVSGMAVFVSGLQTQIANDDTAGNAAAATTLADNNTSLASAVSAINAAAAALSALTQTAPPSSGSNS